MKGGRHRRKQTPREKANELLTSRFLPLGQKRVQEISGASYVPFPQPHARHFGLEQSVQVETHIDARTGALVVLPPGVDVEDVTGAEAA